MGSIYTNSYITISADNAAADAEGFLKPRRFSYINLDIIPLNGEKTRMALEKGLIPKIFVKHSLEITSHFTIAPGPSKSDIYLPGYSTS
jgi:hypothetical protein